MMRALPTEGISDRLRLGSMERWTGTPTWILSFTYCVTRRYGLQVRVLMGNRQY